MNHTINKNGNIHCPFCDELQGSSTSDFHLRYGPEINSRIVDSEGDFVAIPTFGQLFMGSLLVLPKYHVETFAQVSESKRESLNSLVRRLSRTMSNLGIPTLYEHGAHLESGGSCGIYHAHIHMIPLPRRLQPEEIFPCLYEESGDLFSAFEKLKGASQYLLLGLESGRVAHLSSGNEEWNGINFCSQYVRKQLCEIFNLTRPWDWRNYEYEDDLIDTLGLYRSPIA